MIREKKRRKTNILTLVSVSVRLAVISNAIRYIVIGVTILMWVTVVIVINHTVSIVADMAVSVLVRAPHRRLRHLVQFQFIIFLYRARCCSFIRTHRARFLHDSIGKILLHRTLFLPA